MTHQEMDLARSRLDLVGFSILQVFMFACDTCSCASRAMPVISFVRQPALERRRLEKALGNIGWNDEAAAVLSWL